MTTSTNNPVLETKKIPKKFVFFVFLPAAFLAVYFYFGLQHIGQFETADEHYWIYSPDGGRVQQYWQAIKTGDWAGTYINDKPGVTLALVTGPALLFEKPGRTIAEYERGIPIETTNNPDVSSRIFSLFRIPLVIFNGLFSLFFLWALWKITKNPWIALWSWLLILFSPVLIGISQIINPDSLLWPFSTATLLAFFLFLKTKEKKYALLTSLFFGFALLTKYTALIFIPFFLFSAVAYLWFYYETERADFHREYARFVVYISAIIAGAFLIFAIFVPGIFWQFDIFLHGVRMLRYKVPIFFALLALLSLILADILFFRSRFIDGIVRLLQPIKKNFQKIFYALSFLLLALVILNWIGASGIIFPKIYSVQHDLERGVGFVNRDNFSQLVLELRSTVFSIAPLVLLGWLFLLLKGIVGKIKNGFLFFYLMIFTAAFYTAMVLQDLLITFRYGVMLYPVIAILAALGIYEFLPAGKWLRFAATAGIICLSIGSLWLVRPFYFNYSNIFLNKNQTIADGWGYGGYEAAQYLNNLPNAQKLKVWADYRGFCAFFKGTCIRERDNEGKYDSQINYFIQTRRGALIFKQRWRNIKSEYLDGLDSSAQPVWQLDINGNDQNYVSIYKNGNKADKN